MLDILIVDDEPAIRFPLAHELERHGHQVALAADAPEALSYLDKQVFHLVVSDIRLPRGDGFTILRRVREQSPATDVVLMTAYGSVRDAVAAMKEQALEYLTKPFEFPEVLLLIERIEERRRLMRELEEARSELAGRSEDLLTGRSPSIGRLREQITAIADTSTSVLITGESGTGKELVARMIHARSARRPKPFVAVNCAAVPVSLIEAELFGHERGAFTGALKRRDGRFKLAHGGTLFLDEIGEMPLDVQSKLLRVLQEGRFEPIGTNTSVDVDVRVLSATNRDLKSAIAEGRFRQDLYYRIRVFDLRLPPLRERMGDLPLLVEQFLREFTQPEQGKDEGKADEPLPAVHPSAWAALQRYAFPGNVRELKHAIQHALILARGQPIELHHLPPDIRGAESVGANWGAVQPLSVAMAEYEREYIHRTLKLAAGERKSAASLLGISRKSLWQKMVRYGIK